MSRLGFPTTTYPNPNGHDDSLGLSETTEPAAARRSMRNEEAAEEKADRTDFHAELADIVQQIDAAVFELRELLIQQAVWLKNGCRGRRPTVGSRKRWAWETVTHLYWAGRRAPRK